MIYLLTAIGLSPSGRSTVHIYKQTIQRTIRNKQYVEQQQFRKSARGIDYCAEELVIGHFIIFFFVWP
jgi:hypothetical protein